MAFHTIPLDILHHLLNDLHLRMQKWYWDFEVRRENKDLRGVVQAVIWPEAGIAIDVLVMQ